MLFVGDDWAEDHHDIEFQDENGKVLRRARLPEGTEGIARLGEIAAGLLDETGCPEQVLVCIEVDQGPWVYALLAAGYRVYGVDPKQAQRHREILSSSGAKSDKADAHALADMVRTRRRQLRQAGGDTPLADAVKIVARAHQSMIWERGRHGSRLRAALREYFPAMLAVCEAADLELVSPPILALLAKAPTPAQAAKLTIRQILPLLKRRRRKDAKAAAIQQILRGPQLGQPEAVTAAYAATVRASVAVLQTVIAEIDELAEAVDTHFSQHPDHEIYLSQPGLGPALGPRMLAEFGDDPARFSNSKARKNYAGTSPLTKQSGKNKIVSARHVYNKRLIDAAMGQAQAAILNDPSAYAYYRKQRQRKVEHNAALRQLANRLIGILHGCLVHGTIYDPDEAWKDHTLTSAA
jgi:transposase